MVYAVTDRELLERAARAAGMAGMRYSPAFGMVRMLDPSQPETTGSFGTPWSPLTDDGDALRLAVKLGMDFAIYLDRKCQSYANTKHLLGYNAEGNASYQDHAYCSEEHDGDPYAATRRAITRAAAEMAP